MYVSRVYREQVKQDDLVHFRVVIKESDLYISVDRPSFNPGVEELAYELTWRYRQALEEYIAVDPVFRTTFSPHILRQDAPPIARAMNEAAWQAGVGPMAAVAGAMAEFIGRELLSAVCEVIVENGGDIFLVTRVPRTIGIFAGTSPFSNRLGLEIQPDTTPVGVCTSSGTVGPSFSFGQADAAVLIAKSAALADAAATAVGNVVQTKADVQKAVELAQTIPGVLGAVVIKDDQLAAWGQVRLVPIKMRAGG